MSTGVNRKSASEAQQQETATESALSIRPKGGEGGTELTLRRVHAHWCCPLASITYKTHERRRCGYMKLSMEGSGGRCETDEGEQKGARGAELTFSCVDVHRCCPLASITYTTHEKAET